MTDKVNKTIWFEPVNVELLNKHVVPNNMMETMEMEFTEVGDDYLIVKMPVKPQSHQPLGMLHGGASVALAESVGSAAANMVIDRNKQYAVGQSINANHIRAKKEGWVFAKAFPLFIGGRSQVWQIDVKDERYKLISVSTLTMAVLQK